jgi:hypothetical protein
MDGFAGGNGDNDRWDLLGRDDTVVDLCVGRWSVYSGSPKREVSEHEEGCRTLCKGAGNPHL